MASQLSYEHSDKTLLLAPLKGQIDPAKSDYTVGKVKVEIRLAKVAAGRWGSLVGDSPDRKSRPSPRPSRRLLTVTRTAALAAAPVAVAPSTTAPVAQRRQARKNWDSITETILSSEKEPSSNEDPNAGGDAAVNGFFQKLYADADEDTRRAMLKSYQESGGTTLSTNWDEVGKGKVEVKPPEGSEWKKWAA